MRPPQAADKEKKIWVAASFHTWQRRRGRAAGEEQEKDGEQHNMGELSVMRQVPLQTTVSPTLELWSRGCRWRHQGGSLLWWAGWPAPRRGRWLWNTPPEETRWGEVREGRPVKRDRKTFFFSPVSSYYNIFSGEKNIWAVCRYVNQLFQTQGGCNVGDPIM